jgi:hypothetical protein
MTLDLREGSTQSIKMTKKKTDGSPDTKFLDRARLNIISQTETLAKNKVRRELLGLQGTYTRKDLTEKPFVILKLTPVVDMNDPLVRKLTIMQQFNISSELYDQVAKDVPALPEASPVIELPPAQSPVALLDSGGISNDLVRRAIEAHAELTKEVERLYAAKVRGGRSVGKTPLPDLSMDELNVIKEMLLKKPDLA